MLKPFATKLDEETIHKLDVLSHKTQIPKSRLCRQAIELLAAHYERVEADLHFAECARRGAILETVEPRPAAILI